MAVLEILAAANASISIIKTSLGHGKDIASVGKQFATLLGAEEQLKKAVNKKKNSFKSALLGGSEQDFEEFAQLEKLRENKRELEQYMRLMCPAGTYDRYVAHMAQARTARREAEKERERRRQELTEAAMIIGFAVVGVGAIILIIWLLWSAKSQ